MKRSRTAALLIMGVTPLALTSCSRETQTEGLYTSVDSCIAQTNDSYNCQQAFDQARRQAETDAPRYASREACVAEHGADACQPRSDASGHAYFMPLMTGFLIGQLMRGGQTVGLNGAPAFQDRAGNWQRPATPSSGGVYRPGSLATTAMAPIAAQPDRAPTVTRGGFGSRSAGSGG